VRPQTDGICAGFVGSYADGDTVHMVGEKFAAGPKPPDLSLNLQDAFFILSRQHPFIQERIRVYLTTNFITEFVKTRHPTS
jgi:hypothetical protein